MVDNWPSNVAWTFEMVQQELGEGTVRSCGRELDPIHLRIHHGHPARQDDIHDALRYLDAPEETLS
jgi:hypothetical protein